MAKLFEEVVSGMSSAPSSADILIYFSCTEYSATATSPTTLPAPAMGNASEKAIGASPGRGSNGLPASMLSSPSGGGGMSGTHAGSPGRSPRSNNASCRAEAGRSESGTACPTAGQVGSSMQGLGGLSPSRAASEPQVPTSPPFLRCHSLVLQTQPSLHRALLANATMVAANLAGSAGTTSEGGDIDHLAIVDGEDSSGLHRHGSSLSRRDSSSSPRVLPHGGLDRTLTEVTVEDEPEVFIEVIKYVYMNTCHVDQGNVKALMQSADRYGIEDIIRLCLQWMHDHFTADRFYNFLTYNLSSERFRNLVWQSLLLALRSRRHFMLVTEDGEGRWEQLPVPFVEALLSANELPVVSEAEVLQLLARWASGRLSHLREQSLTGRLEESPSFSADATSEKLGVDDVQLEERKGSDLDCDAPGESLRQTTEGQASPKSSSGVSIPAHTVEEHFIGTPGGPVQEGIEDMLRLLRTLRKSDLTIKVGDLDPILELLQLNSMFSAKPPRETVSLDPGFTVYRGVAGVNMPTPFGGGLSQPDVLQHAWKGTSVTLGSYDFVQQQDGFKACQVDAMPDEDGLIIFPRLRVSIECHAWSHREKRSTKASAGHGRPISRASSSGVAEETSMASTLAPVTEAVPVSVSLPAVPGKVGQSQDDWEIGRPGVRSPGNLPSWGVGSASLDLDSRRNSVPNFGDHEKIDHKVICAVVSGHMRHGIRIGQRERTSIYEVEELYSQCDEICIGGSPTEVDFELQLTAQAPNLCGIVRCSLAVLPTGAPDYQSLRDPLMEILFDASAEEQLHFHVSSSHFDSNSSYIVSLNWVLRPGAHFGR